ncbi:MAG: VWA domain-containing protein [Acidobacteria bacterium]|nr:VWA domain-containing protein [Acidobacteriota bacterium]
MHRFLISLIVLSVLLTPARTQQPADSPADSPDDVPIRVLVEEVSVPFIVTDNKNRLITDLTLEDFQVSENGVKQTIKNLARETDVPLRLGLLVDTSNSIRDRLEFEQKASIDFFSSLLVRGRDKALLGSFDSMAELLQDFTDDLDKLNTAVGQLRAGGGTALYDAIYYATRDRLLVEAPPSSNFRRALVLLSDGEDNQSRFSRAQTMESAQRAEVIVYSISTNVRGVKLPGDKVLQEFADETGGRYFQPATWEDLDDAFYSIATELRSQYALSFVPTTPRDGKYHEIEITMPKRKGLRLRARRGYFATVPGATAVTSTSAPVVASKP